MSCTSATFCIAVGTDAERAGLIVTWNGAAWIRQSPADVGAQYAVSFDGVSCTSANGCAAVGSTQLTDTSALRTLAQRWNGSSWTKRVTVDSGIGSQLTSVSCVPGNVCLAVGFATVPNGTQPIAEITHGSDYSSQPVTGRGQGSRLDAISCSSATFCAAGGSSTDSQVTSSQIELWNGTAWAYRAAPSREQTSSYAGVSCSAADACLAVGQGAAVQATALPRQTLAEAWNGSAWRLTTSAWRGRCEQRSHLGVVPRCEHLHGPRSVHQRCWSIGSVRGDPYCRTGQCLAAVGRHQRRAPARLSRFRVVRVRDDVHWRSAS